MSCIKSKALFYVVCSALCVVALGSLTALLTSCITSDKPVSLSGNLAGLFLSLAFTGLSYFVVWIFLSTGPVQTNCGTTCYLLGFLPLHVVAVCCFAIAAGFATAPDYRGVTLGLSATATGVNAKLFLLLLHPLYGYAGLVNDHTKYEVVPNE